MYKIGIEKSKKGKRRKIQRHGNFGGRAERDSPLSPGENGESSVSEGRCAYVRRAIHWVKMKPRDPWKPELRRGSFRALELLLFRATQQTRAVRAGLKRASLDAVSPR